LYGWKKYQVGRKTKWILRIGSSRKIAFESARLYRDATAMNSRTVRLSGTQTELYTSYARGYVCARYSNTAKRYSIRDGSGPTYSLYVDSSESTYSLGEGETLFYVSHVEGANIEIPLPLSGGTSSNVTSAYICDASPVS